MTEFSEDLLLRFQAGDSSAFAELVDEFAPRLKGFFLRKGLQNSTAEDLSQNVFVRLYNTSERYQARGKLDAYCFQIAHNIFIDHCRRNKVAVNSDEVPEQADPRQQSAEEVEQLDSASKLREILAQQDDSTRQLIELAVLQQLSYADVSDILEIPVGTVKSRVFYALRRMRESFSRYKNDL
ncbi:MAG: RNA polymerase sigma factor [Planctomycetota bacterium]|jgi:RNA polymerase sigma-70 factor (ECF subfamily)|nr:RNA polymerase sigma factor [Planctomycetota bacterium]